MSASTLDYGLAAAATWWGLFFLFAGGLFVWYRRSERRHQVEQTDRYTPVACDEALFRADDCRDIEDRHRALVILDRDGAL